MALTVSLDDIVASGNSLLAIKPHWQRVRLGDVGQVLNGYAFKAELFTREGGMPLIRIRDVGSAASETFYSGDFDERYVVSAGDLLVGMDGDFNCARWRGPRSLLNQRVCKITVDEALYLPRFLDYVLPGYLRAINDATSSITVKHLSSRTIQDIPLPLPPMDEQREIVAELEKQFSRLDEAVANLQRVKANLKRYKASVLKAAVEGRLVETEATLARREARTYETGEQFLQRILDERRGRWTGKGKYKEPDAANQSELGGLPDGWTWVAVDAIAFVTKLAGFEYTKYVTYADDGDLAVLKAENAGPNGFRRTDYSRVHSDSVSTLTRSRVGAGDLLMVFVGAGTGNVACTPNDQQYFLGPNIAMIRVDPANVNSPYVEMFLRSPTGKNLALGFTKAVAQPSLSMGNIRMIPVALPPIGEQARIVAEVDRHLSIIREVGAEVDANIQRAQALRQSTLAKFFTNS